MTIREATLADTPRLVEMTIAFIVSSIYAEMLEASPDRIALVVSNLLNGGVIFVAADDAGALVGMIGITLSGDRTFGEEAGWWVEPAHRTSALVGPKLLRRAECWARERGLLLLKMVAPAGSPEVEAFYLHAGYFELETTYVKRFA